MPSDVSELIELTGLSHLKRLEKPVYYLKILEIEEWLIQWRSKEGRFEGKSGWAEAR